MNSSKEKALASTRAEFKTNYNSIFPDFLKIIKRKYKNFSILFWRKNYGLEMNRQDHADDGHLYREIGACLVLLIYKGMGRIIK
jgi:hypothetical protein